MKKRSKQNNPEQKTRNGINNQDLELGTDYDIIKQSKKAYENSGGQPVKSKMHQEPEQVGRTRH
ncbi:glycogen biosynthesis protein GlgD [Pseudoneobacillus sp. C159]